MNANDYEARSRQLELELELAKERKEKFFYKENARALAENAFPMAPLTPEEEER